MTSELKVDKITPASGTNTQIGEAGDTTNLSAGTVTLPTTIINGQSAKTTLADADRLVTNDDGTMKQVALTDVKTYLSSAGFSTDDPTALAIALG